ncbi:MAG: alanine racemase [Acidimicrobiia bacterium]|nr:alanine racemase [Acidimicrobiia bacterium]
MAEAGVLRPVWAEVDLAAIRENVREIAALVAPARVLAVVKADAYGHGADAVARAVIEAGAQWLGVALVEEGVRLREAGIEAPILLLSEPAPEAAASVVMHRLTPVVYTEGGVDALAAAAVATNEGRLLGVHLKVDTGMHRVGVTAAGAVRLAETIESRSGLRMEGVCTHLAAADDNTDEYTNDQLERFDAVIADLSESGRRPELVHAANTAGALAFPRARYDMVRVGIGVYGIAPAHDLEGVVTLRPAMSVKACVSHVMRLPAGERVSYGLRYELDRESWIATLPIGYADGVTRALGHTGGQVLVRGRRFPIAGTVTMDQLMVDLGDMRVDPGEEVVLLGVQGNDSIPAWEWAERLETIPYEVVCGIGPRVPRRYTESRR